MITLLKIFKKRSRIFFFRINMESEIRKLFCGLICGLVLLIVNTKSLQAIEVTQELGTTNPTKNPTRIVDIAGKNSLWELEFIRCKNPATNKEREVDLIQIPGVKLKPNVFLEIAAESGEPSHQVRIKKVVSRTGVALISVEYTAKIIPTIQIINETAPLEGVEGGIMTVDKYSNSTIDHEQLKKSDGFLNLLSYLIFPKHFKDEASRSYSYSLSRDRYLISFYDTNLCPKTEYALMAFKKL